MLSLLSEGLTNGQIAQRLGVSENTAKSHVAEILSKLEVPDRTAAAGMFKSLKPRPQYGLLVGFTGLLRKLRSPTAIKVAGGVAAVTTVAAIVAFVVGILLMSSREPDGTPFAPDGRTGDANLNGIIERLLSQDAESLAGTFSEVSAREGAVIGGPVGLGNAQNLSLADWTSRLGSAGRSLHAAFGAASSDLLLPQPPPSSGVPVSPDPGYDYYIVLSVDDGGETPNGWRFAIKDRQVVDIVITGSPYPDASYPGSPRALTPSPADEYDRFLVLPPESEWPAPTPMPRSATGGPLLPAGTTAPFAPAGRTAETELNRLIEALLSEPQAELSRRFPNLAAREERQIAVQSMGAFATSPRESRVPKADWTARLSAASRSLYAVAGGDPVEVILAVDTGAGVTEAWTFAVRQGELVEVAIYNGDLPPGAESGAFLLGATPNISENYNRFLVLPPEAALPRPPPAHAFAVSTGSPTVDRLLSLLAAHDVAGLLGSLAPGETIPFQESCATAPASLPRAQVEARLRLIAEKATSVRSVANVPAGYQPEADHVIEVFIEELPYRWMIQYLVERQGSIVGLAACVPSSLPEYIVAPPPGGLAAVSPSRRSGIVVVDAVLDALQAGDAARLVTLIDPTLMPCPGEYGPQCLPGETPGTTTVRVLPGSVCHGEYPRLEEGGEYLLAQNLSRMGLYSVTRWQSPPGFPDLHNRGSMIALLMASDGSAAQLGFSDSGITFWQRKCGPPDPQPPVPQGPPSYLLPPL